MHKREQEGSTGLREVLSMKVTDDEILRYIKRYLLATGFTPTYREIGEVMCLDSLSSVYHHMSSLEEKGLIEFHKSRKQYRVTDPNFTVKVEET